MLTLEQISNASIDELYVALENSNNNTEKACIKGEIDARDQVLLNSFADAEEEEEDYA